MHSVLEEWRLAEARCRTDTAASGVAGLALAAVGGALGSLKAQAAEHLEERELTEAAEPSVPVPNDHSPSAHEAAEEDTTVGVLRHRRNTKYPHSDTHRRHYLSDLLFLACHPMISSHPDGLLCILLPVLHA